MAKPVRYTAAAILNSLTEPLLSMEVRKANRMPGQLTWYREVLIKRVGARHVATGRPVDAEGRAGARVEFAEGPGHQTYEVREPADIDVQLTRVATFQMRATVRQAIAYGTRIAVDADQVDELFYSDLIGLIPMIAADAEAQAYDQLLAAPEAAEVPVSSTIVWERKGRGNYVAVAALPGQPVDPAYVIRMDPNASEANRWALRRDGVKVSAHRLLKHAKSAGQKAYTRDVATARAAAATATALDTSTPLARPVVEADHATANRVRSAMLRRGDVVTVTPQGTRQFEVLGDVELDDMVRVYPLRPRCEHDGARWLGTRYVRHVPAAQAETPWDVQEHGDDPEYVTNCPGHPAITAIDEPDPLRDPLVLDGEITTHDDLASELRDLASRVEHSGPEFAERIATELRALADLRLLRVDVVRCEAHNPGELHFERRDCQYPHLASEAERVMFLATTGTRLT